MLRGGGGRGRRGRGIFWQTIVLWTALAGEQVAAPALVISRADGDQAQRAPRLVVGIRLTGIFQGMLKPLLHGNRLLAPRALLEQVSLLTITKHVCLQCRHFNNLVKGYQ